MKAWLLILAWLPTFTLADTIEVFVNHPNQLQGIDLEGMRAEGYRVIVHDLGEVARLEQAWSRALPSNPDEARQVVLEDLSEPEKAADVGRAWRARIRAMELGVKTLPHIAWR